MAIKIKNVPSGRHHALVDYLLTVLHWDIDMVATNKLTSLSPS